MQISRTEQSLVRRLRLIWIREHLFRMSLHATLSLIHISEPTRRYAINCGATYHIVFNPTKVEGKCDACGADTVLRDDDKPETVQKRLAVYHEQTQPLIEYYDKQGILKSVDGTKPMDEVFSAIVGILGE